ncbi:MAG: FG-GAP-like repeat-containing protein, partial [Planctomycetota bacterium]|nr:FG-GAP-like repeat-containing protein [Planctomycetota bacterium]
MSIRNQKSHRKLLLEKLEDKLPLSGNNPLIYWTEGNTVYRSDAEGSLTEEVISISSDYGELTDIDIDREAGNLYMATAKNHDPVNIHRATIDGTDYQLHGDSEDFGAIMQAIGVDPVSKKLYVSPHHLEAYKPGAAPGGMQRLSADGTTVETLAQKPWYGVDIEVDTANGHVYYSGHTGFTGIRRMDLDGSNDIEINTHAFNGCFALDVTAGKIYYGKNHWTDSSSGKTIYSCNLDGSDIQTVVEDTGGRFYDMDRFDNILYLNSKSDDADGNYIKSYNIATTEFTTLFEADGNPAEEVFYDIAVFSAVNDVPTLDPVSDVTIDEDAPEQTIDLTGITDGDEGEQPLLVTAVSSNPGLIPDPTVTYASPNSTGSLAFTPVANQNGTATITVTVEDGGLDLDLSTQEDNLTFSRTFEVTVDAVNDVPTLDPISDVTIDEDASEQTVVLTGITDGDEGSQPLLVTAVSSNPGLIPNPTLEFPYQSVDGLDGLVAYYPFNGNALDESGNSNDGEIFGAVLKEDRHGNPQSAYYFDGIDDFIEVADHPSLKPTEGITVSLWTNWDYRAGREHDRILSKNSPLPQNGPGTYQILTGNEQIGKYGEIGLYVTTTDGTYYLKDEDKVDDSDTYLAHGEWHHVVGTFDGSTARVYHNGSLAYEANHEGDLVYSDDPLFFGKDQNQGLHYKGFIDDVLIYDRPLSGDEIQSLFENQAVVNFAPLPDQFGTATITVTVEEGGSGTGTFEAVKNYDTGQVGRDMTLTDLNADGELDAVIVDETPSGNTVAVLLGEGNGVFGAASHYLVGDVPYAVCAGDFNEDGHVDVVTVNGESEDISILLGDGTGLLGSPKFFPVGSNPQHLDFGDINNDGHLDVIASNHDGNNVSVLTGQGNGDFNPAVNHSVGTESRPSEVLITDIDQDGALDVISANTGSHTIGILLGNNDGTFSAVETFAVADDPFGVAVGDFDNDGLLDLATSTWGGNASLSVLMGKGSGLFEPAVDYDAGPSQFRVAVADFDSDGNQDLVVSNAQFTTLSLLLGNGDGTFGARDAIEVAREPNSVLVADLNKDGILDIATSTNFRSQSLSVLIGIGDSATFSQTFKITVSAVNDVPTLDPVSDVTIDEDAPEQTIDLTGITDGDEGE